MTTTMRTIRLYEATDQLDVVRGWIEENSERIIEAGGELPSELARACRRCNAAKSDKPLLLFLARRTACRR